MLAQLCWSLLLLTAAVSCAYGTRKDAFFWAVAAGTSAIVLGINGFSQADSLMDRLAGQPRPLAITIDSLAALAFWFARLGKWVRNG